MESILSIIENNFWQLLIIIALLSHRTCWKYGIMLLFFQLIVGYREWIYWIIFILTFFIDVLDINDNMKTYYEKRIKELEDRLKDPDYR